MIEILESASQEQTCTLDLCASLSLFHTIIVLFVTENRGTSHTRRELFHWSYPKTSILPSSTSNSVALHYHYLLFLQVVEVLCFQTFRTWSFQTLKWKDATNLVGEMDQVDNKGFERYMCYVIFICKALIINFLLLTKNLMFCSVLYQKCLNLPQFSNLPLDTSVMICNFLFAVGLLKTI